MGTDVGLVLVVILVLVLIWRGPRTLPKLDQALGRGVREARREATRAIGRGTDERDETGGNEGD